MVCDARDICQRCFFHTLYLAERTGNRTVKPNKIVSNRLNRLISTEIIPERLNWSQSFRI